MAAKESRQIPSTDFAVLQHPEPEHKTYFLKVIIEARHEPQTIFCYVDCVSAVVIQGLLGGITLHHGLKLMHGKPAEGFI